MTQSSWNRRIAELKEYAGHQTMNSIRELMQDMDVKEIIDKFFSSKNVLVGTQIGTDGKNSKKLMFELYKSVENPRLSEVLSRTIVDSKTGYVIYMKIYIPPIIVSEIPKEDISMIERYME